MRFKNFKSIVNSETCYGEPQAWIDLDNGRCIEATHEEYGLDEDEQYYSVRVHCSDDEYYNGLYHSTVGIISQYFGDEKETISLLNKLPLIFGGEIQL